MQNKISYLGFELEDVVNEYKIDVNKEEDIDKIPDEFSTIKGFLKEIHYKGLTLFLNSNSNGYSIELNYNKIKEKYKDYISNDLEKYIEFLDYEIKNDLKIDLSNYIDIDEIVKRLKMISDNKTNNIYLESKYIDIKENYYSILLGLTHTLFHDENLKIKDEHINKLEKIANENKDNEVGKVLNKAIPFIKEGNNNFKIKDLLE